MRAGLASARLAPAAAALRAAAALAPARQAPLLVRRHAASNSTSQQRMQQVQTQAQAQAQAQQQVQQRDWHQLHRAAQLAAWSGLVYRSRDSDTLAELTQPSKLRVVASGRNELTSWFVADGCVPAADFCTAVHSRSNGSNGNGSSSGVPAGTCTRVPAGTRERFVFVRGVQWAAHDLNTLKLWQTLAMVWPTRFPRGAATSPLVAHAGVAGIAQELFEQLRPVLDQADDAGLPLCFAGHSLGGALAYLLMVQHQLSRRRRSPAPCLYTFGSPPVLAYDDGSGASGPGQRDAALRLLQLPPDSVQHYVLQNDPVPRALLSVDPAFELARGWGAVQGLLQLRERLLGPGPLSPGRYLYDVLGNVYLIKWDARGGASVVALDAAELEQEMSFWTAKGPAQAAGSGAGAGSDGSGQPPPADDAAAVDGGSTLDVLRTLVLRGWLDHTHGAYATELEAAALRSVKAQLQAEQRQREQQPPPAAAAR